MKKLHGIKAISFDLDGTLAQQCSPWITIKNFLDEHGIIRSVEEIKKADILIKDRVEAIKKSSIKNYYVVLNKLIFQALDIEEDIDELAIEMFEKWFEFSNAKLYQDVLPVLSKLESVGVEMGIISDNFSSDVLKFISKNKISRFFSVIITPDISGFFKPDVRVYKKFAERIGVKEAEILHVGDDLERDYKGALNAGFKALLINRKGKNIGEVNAIISLFELAALLEG